jgi:ATPase family associated with various cellular activities (AAA)
MEPWRQTSELRTRVKERLAQATSTLLWFAGQADAGGLPLNTWQRVDRPLGRRSSSYGPAFNVWHAMLRAERSLRDSYPTEARGLREAAKTLGDTLQKLTSSIRTSGQAPSVLADEVVRRLTSDDIFGTFNGLTSASVLRSEIFPERSKASPSYLAGQIIFSELKVAHQQARASGNMAIRERQPRLAVVAECVHSLMLYVEHLRARSFLFTAVGNDILRFNHLRCLAGEDAEAKAALGGYLRVVMTRMAIHTSECASLVLATRQFFNDLSLELKNGSERENAPSFDALADAVRSCKERIDLDAFKEQEEVKDFAVDFCTRLASAIENVHVSVRKLLVDTQWDKLAGSDGLRRVLARLKEDLHELKTIHTGRSEPTDAPSISDAARFQFVTMLVNALLDTTEQLRLTNGLDELRFIRLTYLGVDVKPPAPDAELQERLDYVLGFLKQISDSPIGKSIELWWRTYADCYKVSRISASSDIDHSSGGLDASANPSWIDLRHESFKIIKNFAKEVKGGSELGQALLGAAQALDKTANKVQTIVRELTDWRSARRRELLQARRIDPHELAASLWIGDRLGEPIQERFEIEAFEEIKKLQRPDGAFPAMAPLSHSRGFIFEVPSVSTIGMLARFVTAGTQSPRTRVARERLLRWKPVLEAGARFLVEGIVGQQPSPTSSPLRLMGWHSDRHPETDRIDCYATTEAVAGLCRLDDALKWIVNLEAMDGLRVSWPEPALGAALPTDCRFEAGRHNPKKRSQIVTVSDFVQHHRRKTALYANPHEMTSKEWGSLGRGASTHVFMLYGPPGTGKTHFQSLAAGELGWPILTLTIADFLFEGEDRVARRADDLFKRLSFLSSVGIVFDEFDDMVARRETYEPRASPGFRPLTSAMLPLLAELSDHARRDACLVACTTNFIDNIDSAAKRVGRVDKKLLVVYPDYHFRLLLGMVAAAEGVQVRAGSTADITERLKEAGVQCIQTLKTVADATALCTFPDISDFIKSVVERGFSVGWTIEAEDLWSKAPLPALNADYYPLKSDGVPDGEVRQSIHEMRASIGGEETFGVWRKKYPDWEKVFRLDGPPVA